jgi:hypothetical protein
MAADKVYLVRSGDCIDSIAARFHVDAATLWNHPGNADLRARRPHPNLLLAGDEVRVPPGSAPAPVSVQPGTQNRYRGVPATIPLRLRLIAEREVSSTATSRTYEDHPLASTPYVLRCEGVEVRGQTDDQGSIEARVPTHAVLASLVVDEGTEQEWTATLRIGYLDPIDTPSGIAQRLHNLGRSRRSAISGTQMGGLSGLVPFQRAHDLPSPGTVDQPTLDLLARLHGS